MAPGPSGTNPAPDLPGDPTSPPANPSITAGGGAGPVGDPSGGAGGASGDGNSVGGSDPVGLAGAGNPMGGGGAGGSAGANTGGDAGSSTDGGSSAGGSAGAAGMANAGAGGADELPVDVTVAVAELTTTGFDDGYDGLAGTATFTQQGDEVTLVLELASCPAGPHISHIHVNPSCDNEGNAAGNHWLPNGELITDYSCEDDGTASYTVTIGTDRWTIGAGNDDTDVDGHSFMVHNGSSVSPGDRVACGVIELE